MGQGFASSDGQNVARMFALLFGLGYMAVGVVGFAATGFTGLVSNGDDALLGLDLNIFHNIVHLAIGAGLVIASRMRDVGITQGVVIGVGLFYTLAALLGFLDYLQIISIDSSFAADNFLHLFSGVAALLFGLIGVRQTDSRYEIAAPGPASSGPPGLRPIEERRAQWDREETYREKAY